jgi:hypothetical protein
MMRTAAILLAISLASPANAEEKASPLPKNTIDCAQFKKTGPNRWIEVGTAVFDLGGIRDIHLHDQPVTPGSFKFGGIDVFPVLEKKCGTPEAPPPETAAKTAEPVALAMTQTLSADAEQEKSAAAAPQPAPPPEVNERAPVTETKAAPRRESKCASGRSVYVADGLTERAGGRSLVEIFSDNRMQRGRIPDFLIREIRNNEIEWAFKGTTRSGRFVFPYSERRPALDYRSIMLSSIAPVRRRSVSLEPEFIKPSREGTGEAILHLQGLRTLLASRRFKIEGKRSLGELPEYFYFDRCE